MTELYILWCARRGTRLHLGFWTAYQCHLIATHPARNLSLYHIPGAFVRNNFTVTEAEDLSPVYMINPPGLFDVPFFVRTNTAYYRERVPQFYAMGEVPAGRAQQGQGGQAGQEEQVQGQRQESLEKAVAELAEENRQARAELARLANVMESVLKELARRKVTDGTEASGRSGRNDGASGHVGQDSIPHASEEDTLVCDQEADIAEGEATDVLEESEEDVLGSTDEESEGTPAPCPAPRRSRRNM